jgi:hypothetical protein
MVDRGPIHPVQLPDDQDVFKAALNVVVADERLLDGPEDSPLCRSP